MSDVIASGEIRIHVNDEAALASMYRVDAGHQKVMNDISRREADVKINANLKGLKQDLKEAEAAVKAAEKRMSDSTSKAAKKRAATDRKNAQERVAALRTEVAGLARVITARKAENATLSAKDARLAAIAAKEEKIAEIERKHAKEVAAAEEKAEKRAEQHARAAEARGDREEARRIRARREADRIADREARIRKATLREEQALERARERAAEKVARDAARQAKLSESAAIRRQREIAEVPKLERQYVRLTDQLNKLAAAKRKASGDADAVFRIELDERAALADADRIRNEIIRRVGREPATVKVRADRATQAGTHVRNIIDQNSGVGMLAAAAVGADLGSRMGASLTRLFRRTSERGIVGTIHDIGVVGATAGAKAGAAIGSGLVGTLQRLGRAAAGLQDMTVRLGPFTTTVRKAITGLALFAPILLDVAGAAGAAVGDIGSAAVGLGALSVGLVGGAIPAMVGFGFVVKDVVGEFKKARTAQDAYTRAVDKNGASSDQAKARLKELKNVMGGVSAATAKTIAESSKLGDSWRSRTGAGRASVFGMMAEGIKTIDTLMPNFAKRTNAGLAAVEGGWKGWMSAMRSARGENVLGEMMDNFNASIGPVMNGLGSLMGYLGRVGAIASRHFPGLAGTFERWAKGINSVDDTSLIRKVDGIVNSAKTLGRFLLQTGRTMKTFFGLGTSEGNRFFQTMTDGLKRWDEFMKTPSGERTIRDFFREAVDGTQALYGALSPIISTFVQWASAMAPISRAFLEGAGYALEMVTSIVKLVGLQGPVTALATTLGTLWAVGKIGSAIAMVGRFAAALMGVKTAATLAGAALDMVDIGGKRGGKGPKGGAPVIIPDVDLPARNAGKAVGGGGKSVGTLTNAVKGAGPTLLRFAGIAGLAGAAAVAFGGNNKTAATRVNELVDASKRGRVDVAGFGEAITGSLTEQAMAVGDHKAALKGAKDAQAEYNRLAREGKLNTDAGRAALQNLNYALQNRQATEQAANNAEKQVAAGRRTLLKARERETIAQKAYNTAVKEGVPALKDMVALDGRNAAIFDKLGKKKNDLNIDDLVKYGQFLKPVPGMEEEWRKSLQSLQNAHNELSNASRGNVQAMQQYHLAGANVQRALAGMLPLSQSAAKSFSDLRKSIGEANAMKVAVKFPDPKQAQQVMGSMNRALSSGMPKNRAFSVVANSKSAEEAIRKLNRLTIKPKDFRIVEKGGNKAVQRLEEILGFKLPTKIANIIQKGGPNAIRMLESILGIDIPEKDVKVKQSGASGVLGKLQNILGVTFPTKDVKVKGGGISSVIGLLLSVFTAVMSIPTTRTVNVHTNYTQSGKPPKGARASGGMLTGPSFAGGGDSFDPFAAQRMGMASLPNANRIDQARRTAELSGTRKAQSQKVDSARYLVGEESYPEYVIATNPRYRQRNQAFARQAAESVGLRIADDGPRYNAPPGGYRMKDGTPAYFSGKDGGKKQSAAAKKKAKQDAANAAVINNKKHQKSEFGNFSGSAFSPTATLAPPAYTRSGAITTKNKKKGSKQKSTRASMRYVENLQTQQEYWERETSIRESQVKEPENWILDGPPKIVKDPSTGEETSIPTFLPNTGAIDAYKSQVEAVKEAMLTTQGIIAELVRYIPQAMGINRDEFDARAKEKKKLEGQIKTVEARKVGKGKNKDARKRAKEEELERLRKARDAQVTEMGSLSEDYSKLKEDRVDSGFDFRENQIGVAEAQEDINRATGRGDAAAAAENASASSSGSGSGGSGSSADAGGLSIGQQQSALSAEKQSVMRDFGSNFSNAIASAVSGPSGVGAGQGMQRNLAALGGIVADATSGSSGVGAAVGAMSGTSVSAAGGAASAAMAAPMSAGGGYGAAPAATAPSGGDKTVIVNNTFANVPPDPHTFAKGVEFEVGSVI